MPAARKKSKVKSKRWFKPVRGSYLPVSTTGWLTYIPFVGYLGFSFAVAILKTQSILLTVLIIVPNCIAAAVVLTYVAARHG